MVVCGNFTEEYLTFPPLLIVEIASHSTKLRDKNTKYTLYELKEVKYYIIADAENKTAETFELKNGKYQAKTDYTFIFSAGCIITLDVASLWESM